MFYIVFCGIVGKITFEDIYQKIVIIIYVFLFKGDWTLSEA